MCIIASAENNAQQYKWFDKKFVDTTNLQIPPEVSVQYRTLVYTMDQRAHKWEQCGPILLIRAALKFSQKNPLLTFICFLFVDNRVGHFAQSHLSTNSCTVTYLTVATALLILPFQLEFHILTSLVTALIPWPRGDSYQLVLECAAWETSKRTLGTVALLMLIVEAVVPTYLNQAYELLDNDQGLSCSMQLMASLISESVDFYFG